MKTTEQTRKQVAIGATVSAVAALALAGPLAARAATPKLVATVGPGETIALKTSAGKRVTTLRPGRYAIVIRDRADDHNFHLRGPGLNRALTSVGFVGTKTVTVRLRAGTHRFVCQPHADDMRGTFRVR